MNLAVRGIDADIQWNNEGSFHKDEFKDKRFDYILANPPFNISDWGGERLRDDARWTHGAPPVGNANYGWLQHILWHLAPNGTAGVVLANGSMSSAQSGEDTIRKAMVEADVVDCMVALPGQLFYSTQIPACLSVPRPQQEPPAARCATGAVRCCSSTPASSARWSTARDGNSSTRTCHRRLRAPITHGARAMATRTCQRICRAAKIEEITGHKLRPDACWTRMSGQRRMMVVCLERFPGLASAKTGMSQFFANRRNDVSDDYSKSARQSGVDE